VTRYLLDTTALIDFSRGREPAVSWIRAMLADRHELGVCDVNVAEFYSGLPVGASPAVDEFLQALTYWDISRAAAARAGTDRYSYARRGQQLSTTDVLVAASARERGAVLVTANVKDYPMTDLEVLPLRGAT